MLCDSDNIPMQFLHISDLCDSRMAVVQFMQCRLFLSGTTDSAVGYLIRLVESIKISSQAQNHKNHVANKSHYTKKPVNPYFRYIDNTLVLRITITNESLYRLTKVHLDFRICHQFSSGCTPSSGNMSHPSSGNKEPPPVEIRV